MDSAEVVALAALPAASAGLLQRAELEHSVDRFLIN